jgi:hypothetical protein
MNYLNYIFPNMLALDPLLSLIGVLVTAVVAYVAGRRNYLKENRQALTFKLWERRTDHYQVLMKYMGDLPLYPSKQAETTWKELMDISENFRNWYFEDGGLYMTEASRRIYIDFQNEVNEKCPETNSDNFYELLKDFEFTNQKKEVQNGYLFFQSKLSGLRTQLTKDLFSRVPGML